MKEATAGGPEQVKDRELTIYRPTKVETLDKDGDRAVPPHAIAAPQRVNGPQAVRATANQPHEFRVNYMNTAPASTGVRTQTFGGQPRGGNQQSPSFAPRGNNNTGSAPRVNNAPAPRPAAPSPAPRPSTPAAAPRPAPSAAPVVRR